MFYLLKSVPPGLISIGVTIFWKKVPTPQSTTSHGNHSHILLAHHRHEYYWFWPSCISLCIFCKTECLSYSYCCSLPLSTLLATIPQVRTQIWWAQCPNNEQELCWFGAGFVYFYTWDFPFCHFLPYIGWRVSPNGVVYHFAKKV